MTTLKFEDFHIGDTVKVLLYEYMDAEPSHATVIGFTQLNNIIVAWKKGQVSSSLAWEMKYLFETVPVLPKKHEYEKYLIAYPYELARIEAGKVSQVVYGATCVGCNTYYPDAEPNLPNNQLKCWSCKNS